MGLPSSDEMQKQDLLKKFMSEMLSMRNGLSMHPLYLPGAAQPMQIMHTGTTFNEGNGLLNTSAGSGPPTVNQEPSNQAAAFDLSSQCTSSNQPIPAPNFGFEHVDDTPYRHSFNLSPTFKAFNRGDTSPELQLDVSRSGKNKASCKFKRY